MGLRLNMTIHEKRIPISVVVAMTAQTTLDAFLFLRLFIDLASQVKVSSCI